MASRRYIRMCRMLEVAAAGAFLVTPFYIYTRQAPNFWVNETGAMTLMMFGFSLLNIPFLGLAFSDIASIIVFWVASAAGVGTTIACYVNPSLRDRLVMRIAVWGAVWLAAVLPSLFREPVSVGYSMWLCAFVAGAMWKVERVTWFAGPASARSSG